MVGSGFVYRQIGGWGRAERRQRGGGAGEWLGRIGLRALGGGSTTCRSPPARRSRSRSRTRRSKLHAHDDIGSAAIYSSDPALGFAEAA